jgi:hypothetical protein
MGGGRGTTLYSPMAPSSVAGERLTTVMARHPELPPHRSDSLGERATRAVAPGIVDTDMSNFAKTHARPEIRVEISDPNTNGSQHAPSGSGRPAEQQSNQSFRSLAARAGRSPAFVVMCWGQYVLGTDARRQADGTARHDLSWCERDFGQRFHPACHESVLPKVISDRASSVRALALRRTTADIQACRLRSPEQAQPIQTVRQPSCRGVRPTRCHPADGG